MEILVSLELQNKLQVNTSFIKTLGKKINQKMKINQNSLKMPKYYPLKSEYT